MPLLARASLTLSSLSIQSHAGCNSGCELKSPERGWPIPRIAHQTIVLPCRRRTSGSSSAHSWVWAPPPTPARWQGLPICESCFQSFWMMLLLCEPESPLQARLQPRHAGGDHNASMTETSAGGSCLQHGLWFCPLLRLLYPTIRNTSS